MTKISLPYFPSGLKYSTPILIVGGIYLWVIGYPAAFFGLTLLSIILLTTNYITELDPVKKEYRDYLSFLGMPFDKDVVIFEKAHKIIIQKEKHSQTLNSQSRSRQLDWLSYTGVLVLDNGKELTLTTMIDRNNLVKKLKIFAGVLNVDIEDRTTSQPFKVDLTRF